MAQTGEEAKIRLIFALFPRKSLWRKPEKRPSILVKRRSASFRFASGDCRPLPLREMFHLVRQHPSGAGQNAICGGIHMGRNEKEGELF